MLTNLLLNPDNFILNSVKTTSNLSLFFQFLTDLLKDFRAGFADTLILYVHSNFKRVQPINNKLLGDDVDRKVGI